MFKNIESPIYAITPTYIFKNELFDAVEKTLEADIKLIQYRFEDATSFEERYETAKKIQSICHKRKATLVINNDHRIAELIGCGLHIGQDVKDTSFLKDTKNISFTGLSCKNNPENQTREDAELFSYYSFGPLFKSKTKKNINGPLNIADVSSRMNKDKLNIAIGGISEINLRLVKQNKFNMAAICNGIYNDPKKIVANCRKLIEIWNEN
tara:strand:+ start:1267 stop:1896 length:630 start_codon:yes stop_codon:yes gene_type:complete